jgi:hypothetical protein
MPEATPKQEDLLPEIPYGGNYQYLYPSEPFTAGKLVPPGLPATEHLGSDGKFYSLNPEGVIPFSLHKSKQFEHATNRPPSLMRSLPSLPPEDRPHGTPGSTHAANPFFFTEGANPPPALVAAPIPAAGYVPPPGNTVPTTTGSTQPVSPPPPASTGA